MIFRNTLDRPDILLRIGLVFLAVAGIVKHFLPRMIALSESASDLSVGLLYGISIGLLLLSLIVRSRSRGSRSAG
jgi:hypothetical protein